MRTVILKSESKSKEELAIEIANILNNDGRNVNDFQSDGEEIIEYDNEINYSVYWHIAKINYNINGTIKSVDLDC
jgi:hypothetical protein